MPFRKRYYQARKRGKTKILNELCAVAGFNRKYAIRILAIKHHEGKKLSGRTKTYSERYYEDDDCDDDVRAELLSMSHASIIF